MPVTWDDAADKQMLLTIIHNHLEGAPKWDQIATMMGEGYTTEGLRKRFKKLKDAAKEQFGEVGGGGQVDGPATPAKKTATKAGGGKKAPSGKKAGAKRKQKDVSEEAEAEAAEDESPEKKPKQEEEDDGI